MENKPHGMSYITLNMHIFIIWHTPTPFSELHIIMCNLIERNLYFYNNFKS